VQSDPTQRSRSQLPGKDSHWQRTIDSSLRTLAVFTILRAKSCFLSGREGGNSSTHKTKRLIAIDRDVEALRELKTKLAANGTQHSVDVVGANFEDVTSFGDVVYFEFCLHEMVDPQKTLAHARTFGTRHRRI
jgi:hypothetical protein